MYTNITAGLLCDDVVDEEVVVSSEQPERMDLCEHGSTESRFDDIDSSMCTDSSHSSTIALQLDKCLICQKDTAETLCVLGLSLIHI